MPSRPSMRWRAAASSLSLPFMNLAAKASMFLPSVTSVTSEARVANCFSMSGGRGSGEVCAKIGAASAAVARMRIATRLFTWVSLLLIGTAMGGELRIHFIERAVGDAQCGEDLPAGFLAFAHLVCASPGKASANDGRKHHASRETQPHHGMGMQALRTPAVSLLHQLALQAGGRGPAFECLLQFALKVIAGFMLHAFAPWF